MNSLPTQFLYHNTNILAITSRSEKSKRRCLDKNIMHVLVSSFIRVSHLQQFHHMNKSLDYLEILLEIRDSLHILFGFQFE